MVLLLTSLCVIQQGQAIGQSVTNSLDVPQTRLAPIGAPAGPIIPSRGTPTEAFASPSFGTPPPVQSGGSSLDPYAAAAGTGFGQPMASPGAYGTGAMYGTPPGGFAPATVAGYGTPYYGGPANQPPPLIDAGSYGCNDPYSQVPQAAPQTIIPSNSYPATGFGGPVAGVPNAYGPPPTIYPSGTPATLFPNGFASSAPSISPELSPYRLFQRGRFRYGYLFDGKNDDDLSVSDIDVALAFACQKFLWSTQPLYIAPSFSLHLWDGPRANTGADLPGQAYSAFLDFSWQSDPNQIVGAELGFNFGAYSANGAYRGDSVRYRGKALGTFRLTPSSTFKLGLFYYDRVDIKMLPAIGWFCRPNPFTRWDIFFPQPKYSRFLSTVGTQDVWWYLAGEYGGGSWTVNRDDGREDQVDLNDIRLVGGFEWGPSERMRLGLRRWHFELGYVGNRKIVYRYNPQDNLSLGGAFVMRLGIGY